MKLYTDHTKIFSYILLYVYTLKEYTFLIDNNKGLHRIDRINE